MPQKDPEARRAYAREYYRKWREANAEKVKEAQKRYRENHPEKIAERREARKLKDAESAKKRYERNREHVLKRSAEYYQRNRDRVLARCKAWALANPDKRKAASAAWYAANAERMRRVRKAWADANREYISAHARRTSQERRLRVLTRYGGDPPVCACCGTGHLEFLSMDHINGDGAAHRRLIGRSSLYRWLEQNDYPEGFRVLCFNCNCAIGFYGYCPHNPPPENASSD